MQITFTKKQYKLLMDMLYMGCWVVNSYKTGGEVSGEHGELVDYVFSCAEKMGLGDLVEHDSDHGKCYPVREYESIIMEEIDEYDNYTFWDDLSYRLARRDVQARLTDENADPLEILDQVLLVQDDYMDEFEANGLDNVKVKNYKKP